MLERQMGQRLFSLVRRSTLSWGPVRAAAAAAAAADA